MRSGWVWLPGSSCEFQRFPARPVRSGGHRAQGSSWGEQSELQAARALGTFMCSLSPAWDLPEAMQRLQGARGKQKGQQCPGREQ